MQRKSMENSVGLDLESDSWAVQTTCGDYYAMGVVLDGFKSCDSCERLPLQRIYGEQLTLRSSSVRTKKTKRDS